MLDSEVEALFVPLYSSIQNLVEMTDRPLLAHYTSLDVLEKIIQSNELWFSNPLLMNDMQEVRFGMTEGRNVFDGLSTEIVDACRSKERAAIVQRAFHQDFNNYDMNHLFDVYVFCLSQHDSKDTDGRLSMWRGYGGNGKGAALVFKPDLFTLTPQSPLLIAKVRYRSNEDRLSDIKRAFTGSVDLVRKHNVPDEQLHLVSFQMFELMLLFSLVSKHHGFSEEEEWRIIYLPNRDLKGLFRESRSYIVGRNGIEPKLRVKIEPLSIEPRATWTFPDIVDRIILGPSISSPLATKSAHRMFDALKKPEFKAKLRSSTIPLRPT
jgi:Protein of unknown function (DUF2971)